jgi:hypothetical protein
MHHWDSVLMIFLCPTCQLPVKAALSRTWVTSVDGGAAQRNPQEVEHANIPEAVTV